MLDQRAAKLVISFIRKRYSCQGCPIPCTRLSRVSAQACFVYSFILRVSDASKTYVSRLQKYPEQRMTGA